MQLARWQESAIENPDSQGNRPHAKENSGTVSGQDHLRQNRSYLKPNGESEGGEMQAEKCLNTRREEVP
jgi:hypothetical protein